jgi:hypothetical protein
MIKKKKKKGMRFACAVPSGKTTAQKKKNFKNDSNYLFSFQNS